MVSRWFIHGDGAVNGDNVAIARDGRTAVAVVPSLRQRILECMSLRSCDIWQMADEWRGCPSAIFFSMRRVSWPLSMSPV